jgi:uncharacterized protein YegP (UPF0339 family)
MTGKFELYKDAAGKFRFRLKAGDGEMIATSEAYIRRSPLRTKIASVKTNARGASVDDQS